MSLRTHTFLGALLVVSILLGLPVVAGALSYYGYPFGMQTQGGPRITWCGSYYGDCQIGTQHVFAPYTYVDNQPYTNVSSSASASASSYASPGTYPQYQTDYMQPTYYPTTYYYPDQYYWYEWQPSYSWWQDDCWGGYGCYGDSYQWAYDPWESTWWY